ncbi:MAG: hypothetical protein MUP21_06395 [Dehalococcoidia bacterium]|nr:hypothetical protein [Dehalococcoidia bacterium]
MKILLAIDESHYSAMCVNMLKMLELPSHTEVKLITVIAEEPVAQTPSKN